VRLALAADVLGSSGEPLAQLRDRDVPITGYLVEEVVGSLPDDLADFVLRASVAEQVDPELGDPANGMQIFRTNCAMCHNAVGAGGALSEGRFAPSLFESTPTEIYEAMQTGPQSMPVFNDANIDPDAKRDVISYLMAQRDTSVGGISLGSIGPVTEGVWVWIVGMGLLVGISVWIGAKSS
jgi:ubiquinol-cytochrome c reductase cytochrome c subunit